MQGMLTCAANFGCRGLWGLPWAPTSALVAVVLPPGVTFLAQHLVPCDSESSKGLASCKAVTSSSYRALNTASSAVDVALVPRPAAPESPKTSAPSAPSPPSAPSLHLDGSRRADPGEPRYTAPYWVPEHVRHANRLPNVLFTDPWPSHDEPELRRFHARVCFEQLKRAGRPLTVEQIRDSANEHLRHHLGETAPLLATTAYVKQLMEHLRATRMVYGKKNSDSLLSAGHPEHPRLYVPLPYQSTRMGKPEQLEQEDAARREAAVQLALRRLKRGKPPYPIHRRRARFSLWQHELAQEAIRALQPASA